MNGEAVLSGKIRRNQLLVRLLIIIISLLALMVTASQDSFAVDFVKLEIYPQNVGVFTTGDRQQQFVAFGYTSSGSRLNITEQVDWESGDPDIVEINEKGLATIVDYQSVVKGIKEGTVNITASYPKTGKVNTGAYQLLLKGSFMGNIEE